VGALARVWAPELHLPEVRRLLAVELNISSHALGAIWETEASTRTDEWRAFVPVGPWSEGLHRELLASADARTDFVISSFGSAWLGGLFKVERQDWWIDAAQAGDLAYRLALPTKALRRARHDRIAARNRVEREDFGADFAFGLRWVCGLDEPARRSRGTR